MSKEIIKEYTNGEITVVWKPKTCTHAGVCVEMLPKVYNPNNRPWIDVTNASTEELKKQIDKCPSGALTYYKNGEKPQEEVVSDAIKVVTIEDGPLMVFGNLEVTDIEGNTITKTKRTAFCRCGHSNRMPYCDGAHKKAGFKG